MSTPIYNPPVPFVTPIQRLNSGSMIYVTGTPTGERFSVNLKMGPGDQANNAFHFNPRFRDSAVVRNTKQGGRWGQEERQANLFPFYMNHQFEMIILCQPDRFKVAINGQHFVEYRHRLPLQNISHLQIQGSLTLQMIRFDREQSVPTKPHGFGNPGMPQPQPHFDPFGGMHGQQQRQFSGRNKKKFQNYNKPPRAQTGGMMLHHNPLLPFTTAIPYPNIRDRSVTIMGMPVNRHPHRMHINFLSGSGDTFFHFNPRFNDRVIVRNAKLRNVWGSEERTLPSGVAFPFQYNVPFQIVISVDRQSFKVTLNGMMVCQFAHRERPLNKIRSIAIDGSATITQVQFN